MNDAHVKHVTNTNTYTINTIKRKKSRKKSRKKDIYPYAKNNLFYLNEKSKGSSDHKRSHANRNVQ